MRIRRAMGVAAATAVLAPLALLSAPVAFATDEPSTSTSSPAADESTPAADESTPAAGESTPAAEESTPAAEESTPAAGESTPAAGESTPGDGGSSAPATSSPSPSPSASTPGDGNDGNDDNADICLDENGEDTAELSEYLHSGLSGLPETVVAGSGWTSFSFDVSNKGDEEIKDIRPLIGVAAIGWDDAEDYSGQIKVQVLDKASGSWRTVADAAGEGGTFTSFSLGAGKSVSYQLRLSVSGKVPDSLGLTGGFAQYQDDKGCWIADDPNGWLYFFDILAAGSDPGKPNDAKPQTGGMKEIKDVSKVAATGSLAETGAGSALPMIGLVGGVAVVAGAGAVYTVRRRKGSAAA